MSTNYLFCYTRTKFLDYRNIYSVTQKVCPQNVQNIFLKRIRAILNKTDDKNLINPAYLYINEGGYALCGIICLNKSLSEEFCTEKTNGQVRGFFGFVFYHNDNFYYPYSLDFYRQLYAKYIAIQWESYTFHYQENERINLSEFPTTRIINPTMGNKLNTDNHYCRFFPSTINAEELLAEAIGYSTDISLAIGVDGEEQVTTPANYPLMNAVMRTDAIVSPYDSPIQYQCLSCHKNVYELYKDNICEVCWKKKNGSILPLNPVIDNQQPDINTSSLNHLSYCANCGNQTEQLYTKFKLCDECYGKYVRKVRLRNIIGCFLLIVVVIILAICYSTHKEGCHLKTTPIVTDTVVKQESDSKTNGFTKKSIPIQSNSIINLPKDTVK